MNNYIITKIAALDGAVRNPAFAKGINRDVNKANANKILADIKTHGYRQAEVIHVLPAEEVAVNGDITLVDINGNTIANENAAEYYLVLDGQHRVVATDLYNMEHDDKKLQVPAILAKLDEGETVAEYISAINITKNEWKTPEYVKSAANVKNHPLLNRYKELVQSEDNPKGFPLSTLNLIYCNNSKALNKTDLSLLCQGKDVKGIKSHKDIIPPHNLERGDKYIALCEALGFKAENVARRYLAEKFNAYFVINGEDYAFKVFEAITKNDITAMQNEKKRLVPEKMKDQFRLIVERLNVTTLA